jgi:S1-C subfamily serine protease
VGIEYIWPESPAARLGVRADDLLVQLGYNRITSVADFQKWLYLNGVGQSVKLIFLRGGREYLFADYAIEERPASARPR